ncbi:thiol reductant ABC exporter subunit CydD [Oceanobacillus sojae]|uniref:thiol reductant ABC exporter subunit CydD n=1 Tax=Oceanobacillus sojae TaxID=582851 RepID=UPI0021A3344E|nr:thiol reductant ABC exporter subunit CydD [Oceanobacillus sojae]MCT1903113.1 thiol reductant ABC exporter subunit CydD [Oceanobacillus sojae]
MLKEFMKQFRTRTIWMAAASVCMAAAVTGQSYLVVTIIQQLFLENAVFSSILPSVFILISMLLLRTIFQYVIKGSGIKMAQTAKISIRKKLLRHFTGQQMTDADKGQSGQKASLFMDTVDEIDGYFSQYLPQAIQSAGVVLIVWIVIFIQNWTSGLIILISAPFIPIFMMIIGVKTKDKSKEQLSQLAAFSATFLDTLQGLPTVKLFGRSAEQRNKIDQDSTSFRDATMGVLRVAFTNSLALEFIAMLSIGLIALEIAIRMIIFQNLSFFTGFFVLLLAPELFSQLKQLGSAFHSGRASMGAASRVEDALEEETTPVVWGDVPLKTDKAPEIRLEQASFHYEQGKFQLEPASMTISPYEQVAIIGKTGAGKSTLLHLLAGFLPAEEGKILIDGIPQEEVQKAAWFQRISYLTQQPYVFSGTVRENILLGSLEKQSDQTIQEVAAHAGIWEWISALPDGLDTIIGEGGRGLSGGEKQRIAIARTLLKKPQILFFDEPTTGLDIQTEHILQNSLNALKKQATMITVAHRLHTVRDADKIFLLDQGEIVGEGTHNELYQHNKMYQQMINTQQGGREA